MESFIRTFDWYRPKPGYGEGLKPLFIKTVAKVNSHPGLGTWFSDNWDDILLAIVPADAKSLAQSVAKGASKTSMARDVVNKGKFMPNYETIQVEFYARSEDNLKRDTCKVIQVPPQAIKKHEYFMQTSGKHRYMVAYSLSTKDLPTGIYSFIFGAQDDGWYYDVAAISQVDINFRNTVDHV